MGNPDEVLCMAKITLLHSWYFHNALVRANYSNLQECINETATYLERFFRNMLLGETTTLRNREMHIDWNA